MRVLSVVFIIFVMVNAFGQADTSSMGKLDIRTKVIIDSMLAESKVNIDNDPKLSYQLASSAMRMSDSVHYEGGKSEALRRIGIFYMYQSDYPKALENILKALKIAESINEKKLISKCYMNLGGIYYDYRDYTMALSYFSKSLKIAKEIKDDEGISGCLINSGNVYTDMKNFKQALDNYQKALKILVKSGDKLGISMILSNLGNVYFYQNNYDAALRYYQNGLKIKEEINDSQGMIICLNNIGRLYLNKNDLDEASIYCSKSLNLAKKINSKDDIQLAAFTLSNIYKIKKDYETALAYYEYGSMVKDSIKNDVNNKEIAKLESKYELETRETQIKLLRKDKALREEQVQRQLASRNFIIVGVVVICLAVISGIQFVNNRRVRKYNQKLLAQNREISAQSQQLKVLNEELDNFVYRSSHDLKAPLTSILGLINISKIERSSDMLDEFHQRMVSSIGKLMIVLSDISNYSKNSRLALTFEPIYFEELIEEAKEDLEELPNYPNVSIVYDIHGEGIFESDKERVFILIKNLLSNAISHNKPNKDEANVQIKISHNAEYALITISDTGYGIEDEIKDKIFDMFYKGSNESPGSGLGLYIVKNVINKLNGSITYETKVGKGTTFAVTIPNQSVKSLASA
ncbi:MAG: tetratricopeptide repeat-containing sensor histidine kinase [Cytophagales bacterium]|nr:tetratricopeptide repeat-containing sensor histidine kinase [Cytophagales bacterium]